MFKTVCLCIHLTFEWRWHPNFFCSPGKYMHRRIQVLLAVMPRVRFNSFQHNLFYFFFHSLCALCLETGQRCTVRTGPHPCVQNPKAGPLKRQSIRKEMFSFLVHISKDEGTVPNPWAFGNKQRQGQAFIGRAILYGMYNQSSVYKPFCTETGLRHYSQKTNAKLTEPLDQSLH